MPENSEPTFTYSKEEKATLGAALASEAKSHVWDHKAPESGAGPKVMTSADVQQYLEGRNAKLQEGIRAASETPSPSMPAGQRVAGPRLSCGLCGWTVMTDSAMDAHMLLLHPQPAGVSALGGGDYAQLVADQHAKAEGRAAALRELGASEVRREAMRESQRKADQDLSEQVRYAQSAEMKCPYVTCSWFSGTAEEYRVHMEGHAKRPVLSWACACGAMGEGSVDIPYAHVRPNGGLCSLQRTQLTLQRQRTFTREEVLAVLKSREALLGDKVSAEVRTLIAIFERME